MKRNVDIAIIGGGPAGLAAALAAKEAGVEDILILERESHLGGILNQCIHNGFGLHRFKEELTGPEYAHRFVAKVQEAAIPYLTEAMVLSITADKEIYAIHPHEGLLRIHAKAIILAMGCRERPRGAILIPGGRPAGVYTAGMAQKLVNMQGYMPGREIVILGSGDIGLIMARRLTWEGAHVKMVCEIMPYSSGLARNVHQCLRDNDIPLRLSHTVTAIHGRERVEAVTVSQVDENLKPIPGTEERVSCDCLLLSVGLIPENELSREIGIEMDAVTGGAVVDEGRQTSVPGVYACGNVLHVHDLVDYVSEEAEIAAISAAAYVKGTRAERASVPVKPGNGIRYVLPQRIAGTAPFEVYFRSRDVYRGGRVEVMAGDTAVKSRKVIKLAPGEMERIRLSEKELQAIHAAGGAEVRYVPE
jgi:NADPH-dependent 2,4-dienoyl-CoA reductase/sulfur reductase-like enzyme